mmetsp:Transcript_2729/g.4282  ORF Transcript_2729/g.4282 Transcript_2729/m.4282 type:complete len:80 (-) Transcript_2729:60-299(-)
MDVSFEFPDPYTYTWDSIPFLKWSLSYSQIKHDHIILLMSQVAFDIIKAESNGLIHFDFPALKHWHIEADETVSMLWRS